MLLACLSSYSYKRQDLDKYQNAFFILAICGACAFGALYRSDANLIMLGYIPWALCLAMILSAFSHWMLRLCGIETEIPRGEIEKTEVDVKEMC
jgi:hypothetical protein